MAKGWDGKVPLKDDGSLVSYPVYYEDFKWHDNFILDATLVYTGISRGRSAAGFIWTDMNGRRYYMFLKDMEKLVLEGHIDQGVVRGKFTFVKRGSNFGITPVID